MHRYVILQNPGHNRVYFESAKKLSMIELEIAGKKFSSSIESIQSVDLAGVSYLSMESEAPLELRDFMLLSRLSFSYAIFEWLSEEGRTVFMPIDRQSSYFFDDDLNSILKYSGKTNELFTRFMLNMAVLSGPFEWDEPLSVLDPMCGKGTTLFEALTLGYNASGLEWNGKMVHEAQIYFKKYLETGKYKHSFQKEKVGVEDRKTMADKYKFNLARSKEDMKKEKTLTLEMVEGDCARLDRYFKKGSFHVLAGDLPYGVQHGGKSEGGKKNSRSPLALLEDSLPAWHKVLKAGGVAVLAYNRFVIKREEMERLFSEYHFDVMDGEAYKQCSHRVDQAILRDIIVCKKRKAGNE